MICTGRVSTSCSIQEEGSISGMEGTYKAYSGEDAAETRPLCCRMQPSCLSVHRNAEDESPPSTFHPPPPPPWNVAEWNAEDGCPPTPPTPLKSSPYPPRYKPLLTVIHPPRKSLQQSLQQAACTFPDTPDVGTLRTISPGSPLQAIKQMRS